jgi:hypothetical protein
MSEIHEAVEAQLNNLLQRKLAEISPDILQKAEEAYTASLHDSMAGKPDYLHHVAVALLAERGGWEPIETAPKDGTLVLGYAEHWSEYHLIRWDASEGYWCEGSWCFTSPPNVWRPLPKPPATKEPAS